MKKSTVIAIFATMLVTSCGEAVGNTQVSNEKSQEVISIYNEAYELYSEKYDHTIPGEEYEEELKSHAAYPADIGNPRATLDFADSFIEVKVDKKAKTINDKKVSPDTDSIYTIYDVKVEETLYGEEVPNKVQVGISGGVIPLNETTFVTDPEISKKTGTDKMSKKNKDEKKIFFGDESYYEFGENEYKNVHTDAILSL